MENLFISLVEDSPTIGIMGMMLWVMQSQLKSVLSSCTEDNKKMIAAMIDILRNDRKA